MTAWPANMPTKVSKGENARENINSLVFEGDGSGKTVRKEISFDAMGNKEETGIYRDVFPSHAQQVPSCPASREEGS